MALERNMILTCPACQTRFRVDDSAIGADGRTVRCANCGHVWRYSRETAIEVSAAGATAPATLALAEAGGPATPAPIEPTPRVEPPSVFSYRWARDTDTEPGDGNSTLVEFTLTEVFAGTLLRVVETGFASLHVSDHEQDKAVQENTDGWIAELAELKEYAERPAA